MLLKRLPSHCSIAGMGLLLVLSSSAIAQNTTQFYEPGLPYTFNGIPIPSQQTLSPATAPELAFRPSCEQLAIVEQAPTAEWPQGSTAWGVPDPNSQSFITLAVHPPGMDPVQAHLHLDSSGICKLNGVDVPVVFKSQLPKEVIPDVAVPVSPSRTAIVQEAQATEKIAPELALGAFLVVGGLLWGAWILRNKPTSQDVATTTDESPLSRLAKMAAQASQPQGGDEG